ncbi:MAG TPA: hypothetical protein VJL57_01695 [Candidatus Paceibacterota bacterium]
MIKLQFEEQALRNLEGFVRHYEEAFVELYRDSGLWSEDLIVQGYRDSAKTLHADIVAEIERRLVRQKILGRKAVGSSNELFFHVGARLIIVHYSEESKKRIRVIESISIDRRPIIF